ncbi:MAG TPA: glycosyltransferase family 9 protein [candidate division Zixibacteria bacterium]
MTKDIKKILIIRLSSLGDVVLTTPVIKALKDKLPQAEIHFLTKSKYASLLKDNPHLSSIMELEDRGVSGLLFTLRKIRKLNFDLVIDLHANLRSFFIRRLSRAKLKIRYNKRWIARFLMVNFKKIKIPSQHTVDSYLSCLKRLDIHISNRMPELYLDEKSKEFAEQLLTGVSKDDILIGIVPGAKWETKKWGEENFAKAIEILNNRIKASFLVFGAKEDEVLISKLKSLAGDIDFMEIIGLPFPKLSALISRCGIILTNDSGPMHIAVALKVPVLAIFGPTHPKLGFSPLGERDTILCANVECSPCSLHGERECYQKTKICMEKITPEMVADEVLEILKDREKI